MWLGCTLTSSAADIAELYGRNIASISFPLEQQTLSPHDRQEAMQAIKTGELLTEENVRQLIKDLFATGRFEDVALEAEAAGNDVVLRVVAKPALFVRNVIVQGVKEPPTPGQLQNATKLQLGERFYPVQMRQATENILESLRSNGLYKAQVTPEQVNVPEAQQIDLLFRIDPGDRAKFSRPSVRGNTRRSDQAIINSTRWKRWFGLLGWREVTQARVQSGLTRIRRGYQKQNFLMAEVALEQMEYNPEANRVKPILNVESGSPVRVTTTGAKVSKGRLRELVPVFQEQSVDRDLLVEGMRNLTAYFQARGYFEAQVDFDESTDNKGDRVVEYAIAPGEKHKLVLVEITGNRYFDQLSLRERMYTVPASFRFRNGRFSEEYIERDANAIKALYQSNGFRDVNVETRVEDDYQGRANEVAVFFEITEGNQWLVEDVQFEGVRAEDRPYVEALVQSISGQPYSDLTIATDQDAVLNYYFSNGYPTATFEANLRPGSQPYRMDIEYVIRQGERQYVRDVLISGLQATDRELVLSRIRNLEPGEPLSQVSMNENQRRLYDLGVFARVDTAIQNPDGDTQYKHVLYRLEEARKYSFTLGFGAQLGRIGRGTATTFDAPAGATGFAPRISLGVNRVNFLGLGHTVGLQTRLSTIQRRALLTYLAPQFKGNEDLSLSFTGVYDDSRDINTFNAKRLEGSIQLSQRLSKANTAQYRIAYRRTSLSDVRITEQLVPLFNQAVQLGIISGTFIQDRRDDPTDATRGIYNTIDVALASSFFGSSTTFVRSLLRNATYKRLGRRELILARSTSFGVLTDLGALDVPLPERFFAGGASSHRGFGENQAGPRDVLSRIELPTGPVNGTGFPIGGKALLMNTVELRFPLLGENVSGVVFHDAGNVYSSIKNLSFRLSQRDLQDFDYMVHAVGFGVRYRTPIGPVRFDLAYGLNTPRFVGLQGTRDQLLDPNLAGVRHVTQRISRIQFHFSLGQAF
jgi:outer membrane protein insertion porin family